MVTRKKLPRTRVGLLYGPSRKQNDVFTPRTGEYINQIERRETTPHSYYSTANETVALYTCPAGKRAKITYLAIWSLNSSRAELDLDTTMILLAPDSITNDTFVQATLSYEDGIQLREGQVVYLDNQTNASDVKATIWVIEENASPGYFLD